MRWRATVGFALVLAGGCTKPGPVQPRTRELPGCGPIAELTEVGGRVYGVSDQYLVPGTPPASACAFDLGVELDQLSLDTLTWDGHAIVGGNDQIVDADGVQTIIASWLTDEERTLHVGLLRRTSAGLERLDSVARREAIISELDAVRVSERVVVGFTRQVHNAECGESYDAPPSHWMWRVGDELAMVPSPGTAERIMAIGDDLLVAGIWSKERRFQAADEIRVWRVAAAEPNAEPRWLAQLRPRDGEARPYQVLDLEVVGGSVYVLSQGKDRVWLSRVSADTGAIGWSLVGDGFVGELTAMSAGRVRVTTLAQHGSEHELRRFVVDEAGELGPTRAVAVTLGSQVVVTTIASGEGGRVWLGGYLERLEGDWSTSWIGVASVD